MRPTSYRAAASTAALSFFLLASAACSDRYWIRKAESAHQYRVIRFHAECVDIPAERGPAECPKTEAALKQDELVLDAIENTAGRGPLSKQARTELKAIAKKP